MKVAFVLGTSGGGTALAVLPALAGGAAEAGPDPPEQAVADAVTRIRLAAAKIVETRMFSPIGLSLMSRY
jgi:hypothetical protein